jgi:hypothetical protein
MGLQNIFPTPIYTHFVPQDIADKMEEIISPKLKNLEDRKAIFTDYFSKEKIISDTEIKPFLDYINFIVHIYSQESNIRYHRLDNFWVQDYQPNHFHEPHLHPGSTISGTYYIRANTHAGKLLFHNPNPHSYMEIPLVKPSNNTKFSIKPQKGLLVLFPSWLQHEILPSPEKDVIRTSFSFNYKL